MSSENQLPQNSDPIIDSEEKSHQIDLTEFEDFTLDTINSFSKNNHIDPHNPLTWTPQYCIQEAIELMHIREEMQDIISKNFEDTLRNRRSNLAIHIPRTLFRVKNTF